MITVKIKIKRSRDLLAKLKSSQRVTRISLQTTSLKAYERVDEWLMHTFKEDNKNRIFQSGPVITLGDYKVDVKFRSEASKV